MARASKTNAGADVTPATDTPSPSDASGSTTQQADREGGSEDAASSNGASDQLAAGEGGDALAGGDATDTAGDNAAEPDGASAFAQTVGDTAVRLAETLTALSEGSQSSPSSAPQVSGLASVVGQLAPSVQFVGGRFTEVVAAVGGFKVGTSLPDTLQMERDVTVSVDYLAARAARRLELDKAGWNALDDDKIASELSLEGYILDKAIDWPWSSDEDVIEVTAISRDGQPYRRCRYLWAAAPQTIQVHHLVADRLKADPFIVVQAESVADEEAED